ncbi:neither inactivation nor afterpotential protein C isoform X2 [Lutzomyia longipalpis]|uniref:neither inactivation nor afterpotential protein C isoform X2 n=1 Tax=Lutzomyia longipalpis TaxID=7200 RepID=UPI002483F8E1|nr:neither inactivation nor afterpotential protein C isoform X2 [Lutzomyia longipalpis]
MSYLRLESLPDPGNRFELGEIIGKGVCAEVFRAVDTQNSGKRVAIKIQSYEKELRIHIEEEFRVLRDYGNHPNLPRFYGVFQKKIPGQSSQIWFVLELCEGGPAIDLVRKLDTVGRRLSEEQIGYILRETSKAVVHLHSKHIVHRDVRGCNIMLTGEGEVKLCDFGLARDIKTTLGKRGTNIGSPNWMAPEMFSGTKNDDEVYGSRCDVWAMGITAIELGDGSPPFKDMHPTRVMFQIVRNPPPTLNRPANWSQNYNDFISECLEKNPEHRPFMVEVMEHPFFTELPENDYHLSQELKVMLQNVESISLPESKEEIAIFNKCLKKFGSKPVKMYVEDLSAMERITEESILNEINCRLMNGQSYTFVGDVLLSVNSNDLSTDIPLNIHSKYKFKSRSDNAPHIFSVADKAYQDMLHHEDPQHIILAGESYSGKTTNRKLLLKHLSFLGDGNRDVVEKVQKSFDIIDVLTHAGTPTNPNSTRCVLQSQLTFGSTGKLSGVIHNIFLLEKSRISGMDLTHSNFHIIYFFYDAMSSRGRLGDFMLDCGRKYRYLRVPEAPGSGKSTHIRDNAEGNAAKFAEFEQNLLDLGFSEEHLGSIHVILAAILLFGELRFLDEGGIMELENPEVAARVARLLGVEEKKFLWALLNYCIVERGTAERRRHTGNEAREARDVLAGTLFSRLVDWITNTLNHRLTISRAIFGDAHSITLLDMFGFECFPRNRMEQLFVNCLSEQMQYHFSQRMFVWEMIEQEEEHIPVINLRFYDNKQAVDHIMAKPRGLMNLIDDATRARMPHDTITSAINVHGRQFIRRVTPHEFSVAHYTGRVTYDARDFPAKNRDFVPPEMLDTLRASGNAIVKTLFTNALTKTGNLTMPFEEATNFEGLRDSKRTKWGVALVNEKQLKTKKINTLSHGAYSQVHKMRTLASVFRQTCLEVLRSLAVAATSSGVHFVRCIRADLENNPRAFHADMVRQQLKALAIVDTAVAGQKGFPYRLPFPEFLRRYKFLAFDFNEPVDVTRDNCRLLLVRLKMEGWAIGKTKVFLKYYNVEYLARLYETQVKKIIKVQAMMRAFLAKRSMVEKLKKLHPPCQQPQHQPPDVEKAALFIQKAYRGYIVRKQYGPLIDARTGKIDAATALFVRNYAQRWRTKTVYQVLLHYRAARFQDLVNFSQQIHIYNQRLVAGVTLCSACVLIERVDPHETVGSLLGVRKPSVWKLPFRLDDIPYFDTSFMCHPGEQIAPLSADSDDEAWDAPMKRRTNLSAEIASATHSAIFDAPTTTHGPTTNPILSEPYCRESTINAQLKRRAPQPPASSVGSNVASSAGRRSSTPYEHVSVGEILGKFDDGIALSGRSSSYKKRQAPQPPNTEYGLCQVKRRDSGTLDLEQRRGYGEYTVGKIDPVREMKMLVERNSEEDSDEPPFNFQGMLRKTTYNRASMKRSTDNRMPFEEPYQTNGNASPDVNVVYESYVPSRPKSCQGIVDDNANESFRSTSSTPFRKFSLQQEKLLSIEDEIDNHFRPLGDYMPTGEYICEEIAPGIILEGYADEV